MTEFIAAVQQEERGTTNQSPVALKTGEVLGALEVFTFANFSEAEQEVIFAQARRSMSSLEKDPPTVR